MAIKAGRAGVHRSQVDNLGRIKQATIPIATSTKVGGVKPESKTSAMKKKVGITEAGKLYAETEVPDYTASEAGKVLTVGNDGSLEWAEKQGGGGGDGVCAQARWVDGLAISDGAIVESDDGSILVIDLPEGYDYSASPYGLGRINLSAKPTATAYLRPWFFASLAPDSVGVRTGSTVGWALSTNATAFDAGFSVPASAPVGTKYLVASDERVTKENLLYFSFAIATPKNNLGGSNDV